MRRIAAAVRRAGRDGAWLSRRNVCRGYGTLNNSNRRTRRVVVIAVAAVGSVLVLGVAFFLGLVPDVPATVREPIAVAMLKHRTDRSSFERFLRVSGADWHKGYGYQTGAAFSAFGAVSRDACTIECDAVVQTAFRRWFGICSVSGDVVSARFDKRGQLLAWNLNEAADGC
jgi:hypothetical protein